MPRPFGGSPISVCTSGAMPCPVSLTVSLAYRPGGAPDAAMFESMLGAERAADKDGPPDGSGTTG